MRRESGLAVRSIWSYAGWSYAGLALALVVAAALIVPGFVDWSGYADVLEEQAEALTGRQVEIAGPVRISLLPSPKLSLGPVTLANMDGAAEPYMFTARAMTAELSLAELFRGVLTIEHLILEQPAVMIERSADGRRNWDLSAMAGDGGVDGEGRPGPGGRIGVLSVRTVTVRDGVIAYRGPWIQPPGSAGSHPGQAGRLAGIDAEISAAGPRGPFRARGTARAGGRQLEFALALGAIEAEKAFPANFSVHSAHADLDLRGIITGRGPDLRFDGAVAAAVGPDAGPLVAAVAPSGPMNIAARVLAGDDGVRLREIAAGPEAGAPVISGSVAWGWGPSVPVLVDLAATRLDLSGPAWAAMPGSGDGVVALADRLLRGVPAGTYAVRADEIVLPGGSLRQVKAAFEAGGDVVSLSRLAVEAPGPVTVEMAGALSRGEDGPYFAGDVRLEGARGDVLARWLAGGKLPAVLRAQPLDSVGGQGHIFLTGRRLEADRVQLRAGDGAGPAGTLAGHVAVLFGPRPQVTAELELARLALPALTPLLGSSIAPGRPLDPGVDGNLILRGEALSAGPVRVSSLLLRAQAGGGETAITELVAETAEGAKVTLTGRSDVAGGRFQATLTAPDVGALEGLALLRMHALDRLAPFSASAQIAWPVQPQAGAAPGEAAPPASTSTPTGSRPADVALLARAGVLQMELAGQVKMPAPADPAGGRDPAEEAPGTGAPGADGALPETAGAGAAQGGAGEGAGISEARARQAGLDGMAYDVTARLSSESAAELGHLVMALAGAAHGGDRIATDPARAGAPQAGGGVITLAAQGRIGAETALAAQGAFGSVTFSLEGKSQPGAAGLEHAYEGVLNAGNTADLAGFGLEGVPLEQVALTGAARWRAGRAELQVPAADLARGQAHLAGSAMVTLDTSGEVPVFDAAVQASELDLGLARAVVRWLVEAPAAAGDLPAADDEAAGAISGEAAPWGTGPLVLHWVSAQDGRLRLSGDNIGAAGWRARAVDAAIGLSGGEVTLEHLRGELFGGEIRASGRLATRQGAELELAVAGRHLDLAGMDDALPFGEIGSGRVDLDAELSGRGLSALALVSSLKGAGRVALEDGSLSGLDLAALSAALSDLSDLDAFGPRAEAALNSGQTPVDEVAGNFEMTSGVLRAPALKVVSPAAAGRVAAFADFGRLAVDVEAEFDLAEPPEAPAVTVSVSGRIGATQRRVNALALEAFAAQRVLERDIDALAAGGGSSRLREILGLPPAAGGERPTPRPRPAP